MISTSNIKTYNLFISLKNKIFVVKSYNDDGILICNYYINYTDDDNYIYEFIKDNGNIYIKVNKKNNIIIVNTINNKYTYSLDMFSDEYYCKEYIEEYDLGKYCYDFYNFVIV